MPDSIPAHDGHRSDMADSIPLIRQIVRHQIGTVSVMLPEGCPPSFRNRVRHGPAHALRLFSLAREVLERLPWRGSVTGTVIQVNEFQPPEVVQADLFDVGQRATLGWTVLLDTLRARLGEASVRQLGLRDDHRPEHAWGIPPVDMEIDTGTQLSLPQRPLWLIEPVLIERPEQLLGRPERIEAGWWSGTDTGRGLLSRRRPRRRALVALPRFTHSTVVSTRAVGVSRYQMYCC